MIDDKATNPTKEERQQETSNIFVHDRTSIYVSMFILSYKFWIVKYFTANFLMGVLKIMHKYDYFFCIKKLREPFLPKFTEVETPQVTPSKLPHGTRNPPLSAATSLS